MKFEYLPPLASYPSHVYMSGDSADWAITAMVSYYQRTVGEQPASASHQLFWPVNPWHELDEVEKNGEVSIKH
jgi:hypothetical protein